MVTTSDFQAAIYVRISKDSEAAGLGVKRQREDCEKKADELGWPVAAVFEDNDVSATRGVRPGYRRMVNEIEAGNISAIIVWDVDRLTRTPRELEDIIDWADKLGLELASVTTDIKLATPGGRAMARMKGTVAKMEAEQQSVRLKRKLRELAEKGQYVGPRPFGWDWETNSDGTKGKSLVINDEEAAIVRDIAARILADESLHSITRDLNKRGILTARGAKWRSQNVRKLVLRASNAGVKVHNGVEIGKGSWPAIHSRSQHDRLVSKLTDPDRVTNRGTAVQFLLSGLINCAECGQPMHGARAREQDAKYTLKDGTVKTYKRSYPDRYRCHPPGCSRVQQSLEMLDVLVTDYSIGLLEREGVKVFGGDQKAADKAREQVLGIEAKLNIAADNFADGGITPAQFQRINERLRPRLAKAQAQLHRAAPTNELRDSTGKSARQAWVNSDLEQRRAVIRALRSAGFRVEVGKPGRETTKPAFNTNTVRLWWGDKLLHPPSEVADSIDASPPPS